MAKKKIEDAYPLSPIQQGMLFHDIQQPGAYFVQVTCTLLGALDASAFEAAWQGVADRHPVLRSAFAWKNTPTPLQVVGRRVEVPFRLEDWSDLDAETRDLRWHFLLEEDHQQGVDLSRPPLMRLTLVRVAEEEYRFLWSLHHLLLDGWSYPLVLEEVIALYEAAVAGAPEPQLPQRRPFRDYIAWLRRQDLDRAKDYWRRRLKGIGEPTPLGIDGVAEAPAEDDETYAEVHLDLGTELSAGINALAASHNLTAAAVVEGAWGLLLARYSGRREVVFGSIGSGRPAALPGVEGMIGMFVSTLPVRVAVEPDTPLVAWLQKLQGEQLDARQYEYTPLVEIQRWSDVTAGQPLFETCLSFQNYPLDEALAEHTGSLGFRGFQIHEDPGFPIMVVAIPGPAMALKVEHDLRRVSADAARRLLRHLENLLQEAVADPHQPVRRWTHLTDGERHQLEVEWNASVTDYPRDLNLHQLIERQARATPEAAAAVDGDVELTYAELNRRANRLAHALRGAGVGPEVLVGLCVERSPDLLVGMLGILKAGGAYLPLDSEHPDDRLAGLVKASGAEFLVARDEVLERLPALAAAELPRISPQLAAEAGAGLSEEDPEPLAGPDGLAYTIYTSGSTGAPKGVLIPHGAVVNYSLDMVRRYRLQPEDRVLQFASLGFNVVVEEVFPTLLAGAAVVLHREDLLLSLQELERVVADNGITGLELPAAFWHQWVHDLEARGETPPESLRFLLLGCERPKPERLAAWQGWGIDLLYVFGLTETTVTSSLHRLSSADAPAYELPIGRPVANTRLYVLDSDLQPVAARVVGQLYIAGAGVGRGYLKRPDLTAERFVPDPFAAEPGARMYRTGDRARYRAGGEVDFLGRADFQLKIRGYRVEPGEVEAALEQHPAVRSSVVVARPGPAGDARLVAFLTLSEEGEEDADAGFPALRQDLAAQLPDYMVPSRFVALKELPLSPNGKVDRRALPEVDVVPQLVAGERVAPRSELESQLAEIWRQVLGLQEVGVHDDFFELGGDSILSIQITARANREGLGITARQLFEHPTIAGLAAVAGGEGVRAEQGPVTGATPLTPIQHWFLDGERNGYDHFTLPVAVELAEALQPAVLEGALERLLEHHDALRGRYLRSAEGRWQMELAAPGQVPSPGPVVVDLTRLGEADQAAALERQGQGIQGSLDIAAGRLLSAALFRRTGDQAGGPKGSATSGELLVLACHHLAVDAVSWRILLEDLMEAGGKLAAGEEPGLPPKTTSWQTWAEVLAQRAASPALAREADFWLAPERAAVQPLPVDHDGAEDLEDAAETVTVRLDAETTAALLQDVPRPYRTRINDALLSALGTVLARWTGEELQLVELEAHGREEQMGEGLDLSRTVGWFTALVPVLLDLRGAEGPGQRLMAVKEQLRSIPGAGLGHGLLSSLPLAAESEGSGVARRLAELPDPQVLFNYVGRVAAGTGEGGDGEQPLRLVDAPIGAPVAPGESRSHRLVINAGVRDDELEVAWTFGSRVYDRGTVEGLAQQLLEALAELVDHCKSPEAGAWTPSDFPLAKTPIPQGGADLTQPQLDALLAEVSADEEGIEVEDLYPLSPLQKGMLFHALYSPQAGLYMAQVLCRLKGDLDLDAFLGAWQDVMERRAVLRTSFRWDGLEAALQLVQRSAELPANLEDWREVEAPAVEQRLQEYLQEDRQSSFELDRAPLQRLLLARLEDDSWQLVWSFHQSIFDGWSLPLLFQDLFASYGARVTGEAAPSASELPPAKPYRDYIAWLQQQDPAAAQDYWTRQLADFTDPTPLPEDRPAPPGPPVHGEQTVELSPEATAALGALARRSQLTVNTLAQGAWALLLSLYSREDDVVFGGTVAGRPADLPGVESIVGLFINTLPVRVEVAPNRPVLGWLREIQERQAEQRQFQHTALADIQRWSQLSTGESLFDSFLVFQNYPVAKALEASPLIKVEDYRTEERPHYGLTLVVHPLERLRLELAYDARRLEAVSVRRLLGLLDRWLTAMADDPWARLRDLSPLSEVEEQQLLVEWNDTATGRPVTQPVHRLFERQAAQRPAALALELGDQRMSYADLDRAANRLARHLRGLGVAPGVTVGLCVLRSLDMVVGTLAIWKAGGIFVPLDPSYPEERLNFIVEDSAPPVIVAGPGRARSLPESVLRVDLEADAAQWRDLPSEDLSSEDLSSEDLSSEESTGGPGLGDLAYLIYTSGTTGRPKAVEVEHGNLAHTLTQVGREFGFHAGDAMLYMASFAFDISLFECFVPLLNGGTVLIQTRQDVLDLAQLEQRLERATLIHAVPTLMRQLVDDLRAAGGFERRTAGVRRIFLGGDRVPAELIRDTQEVFPDARVVILYGPTEATIVCASYEVPRPYLGDQALIGRPLPGVGLRLVGAFGVPVPVGVPGEVWISGPGVTRGYRSRTQLTEEKFVEVDGVRWYRTGDLARWLPSGVLEFRGRIDQQVKIRGFRIEVGEIEAVLGGHPQVGVAVVMAREDSPGDRRLVAYTVAERGEELPSTAELREYAEERLPEYMVPALFIPLEELPLSPTGKVDRRALPVPEIARGDLGVDYLAPRNRRETLLAEIFAAVLKTKRVGVHDSFFDLGGDSILSIQIVSRAKAEGFRLSPRQIFEHPTVAALAALDAPSPALGPDQGLVTGTMTAVPVQRELLEGEHPPEALAVGRWLRIEAPADTQALTSAVARLQLHHDALRLRRTPEGELVLGGEEVVTPLEVLDLSDFSDAERAEREAEVAEDARLRVAAAWPHGFRALLFLDGSGGGRLLLLAHRLGMDVSSWRFLITDLDTLYSHYRDTTAVQLPAKSGSFKQWSEVLMARGGSDELRQEAPWWRARADVEPLFPQRPVTGEVRRARAQSLSRELTESLFGPALEPYRLQPEEVLVAALAAALAEHGGQRRLRLSLDVDGRKALSLETDFTRSVGHFDVFFPLTLEVPPKDAIGELLKGAKEAHRGAPRDGLFYGLLRHHGLEEAAGAPPQVCLQWKVLDPLVSSAALSFEQALDSDPPLDRGVGLLVEAATVDGALEVHWIVREGFLDAAELEDLEVSFEGHLERIVEHCLDPAAGAFTPSDFPWAQVTQEELDRLAPGAAGVDDVYDLSPLQQGMLFHEVDEPGAYLVQITCTLHGALDLDAFHSSWDAVVAGIPMLRTSFRWRDTSEPLQVVHSTAELPLTVEDWSDLERDEQDRRLTELRSEDRRRRMELDAAPLMRLTLVRRGDDEIFFLWTLSHIILDGWSYPLVLQNVLQRYQALVDDAPSVEIHHPPFRDYIRWLSQQDLDEAEGFWRRLLSDVSGPTPLGVDRRRGDEAAGSHEERRLLSAADTQSLSAVAARHRLTVNTLVEGAWALLLARYSGEDSVVFGAIGSGRPADLAGVEGMIGLFLNTLPVRAWLEEDEELVPWLRRLQGQRLTARQYEFTPLAKIQQWSGVGGGQPLFESSVSFQNYPLDESLADGAEGLSVSGFHIGEEASFPLLLGSMPGPQLPLIVEYQRSRFDDATIHRLLGHLETLLLEMAREPERRLSELSLLTATEREQLLEEWSGELGPYPDQDTVHSLVFAAGETDPQAPAVLCGEVTLSHGELAAASAALAREIVATGATPGTLVGLCVQRSERLVVGLMGILQAGCAYVPLDPAYPADRLAYMVEDSSAPLVVTEAGAVGQLPEATGKILLDELMEKDPAKIEPEVALPDVSPDQLAYVIYTSGSTGKPKGVMISHRMVVQYTVEMVRQFGLDASDRVLQFASLSFDVVVEEVYPALAAGAAVVVPSQDLLLSTAELERELTDHGVTGLELPAAYWQEWVHAMVQAGRKPPESLRWILVGCEKPQQERLASWRQWNIPLYIVFGLTETTVTSTLFRLEGAAQGELSNEEGTDLDLPIGKPVANSRVWVLDDRLEPVPVGVTGQLYVGGLGVGRGYLGRPALTAERFGPDPLSSEEGARWYRTGDLARWRENGDLEFLGRMDHQVKVRGFRVELGEIEQALGDHPGVREAAVVAHTPGGTGSTRLVGYVVYEEGADLGAAELRGYLRERLPEYMVPASLVELGSLPLTPNGKVDRDALPAPGSLSRAGEQGYEPPRNDTEKALAEVWSEVLGVESVGVYDDFFELGGDSILSIQLTTRARKAGVEINPRLVFENPTIAELAKVAGQASKVVAEQGEVTGALPLLPIQSWYFGQDPAEPDHFQLPVLLALEERWEAELLAPVVAALVAHHDALRTRFEHGSGGWEQELLPVPEDGSEEGGRDLLEVHDLSDLDRQAQDAAVAERSVALKASLDLSAGRVFRTAFFDLGPDRRQRLLLAAHHLVVDTVSLQTLVGDLADGYRQLSSAESGDKKVELAPKTTSIRTWAEKLQAHVEAGGFDGEESYWLAPERAAARALPVDHPEAANLASGEKTLSARLDAGLTAELLGKAPRAYRMNVQEVLLTALAQTVSAWAANAGEGEAEEGENPLLVDLEGHGREEIFDDVDLSRTVGWFASLYPVLLDVSAAAGPKEALQTAKEQLRRIPGRGGLGWGLLATYGSEETRSALAAQPAAPLLFNYVGQLDRGLGGDLPVDLVAGDGELPAPEGQRRGHLLEVNASVLEGTLEVAWTFSTAVHDEATVRRLADSLVERLAALVEHCLSGEAGGFTPSDFPLASLDQQQLDEVLASASSVEDIYGLSPLQQGMLFHNLVQPEGGFYMAQNGHQVAGRLDIEVFRGAWQTVVDAHPVLRTSFRWDGLDEPVQVVHGEAEVPVRFEDWSDLSAQEQRRRLDDYLEQDRRESFPLDSQPPLMRFLVARLAPDVHHIEWSFHQILFDGWSLPMVFQEFALAFRALSRGGRPELPQRPRYRDHIGWLRSQDRAQEEAYWRRALAGVEEATPLPFDRPAHGAGAVPSAYEEREVLVDAAVWERLQERSRQTRVTINTLVQGAWAQLLGRYSRRRDVVFGAVVSGRPAALPGVETMIGLFINNLPVRASWEPSEEGEVLTAGSWLQGLQEDQAEQRQYEHSALVDVQRWSGPSWGGQSSEPGLFNHMLVFQNYPVGEAITEDGAQDSGEGDLSVSMEPARERSHFPLTLVINPQAQLSLSLAYDTARFDHATIDRIFGHLERLLEELPADPSRPLDEVPMLSAAERDQLSAWGHGEALPAEVLEGRFTSLPRRVAGMAETSADAPAVRGGDEVWSFGELARRSAAVRTALLRRPKVDTGTLVGLCLHRTADLPAAILGVLEAGCAFVPLDPDYPAERLAYMVEDSELAIVLGHGEALDGLPEDLLSGIDTLRLEDLEIPEQPGAPVAVNADDLAYLIYTSGTTGKPKAVMVEHGNLAHTTSAAQQRFGFELGDLMLCLASYSFDIFLFECLMPLAGGAAVEVVGREATLDQDALAQHVASATRIHGVPTLLRQVTIHAQEQDATYEKVRTVFVGGDRVPGDLVTELEEVFPQAKIEVLYGPTEATIICSHASPERGAEHWRSLLGRPLPGVELRLLGPDGRAVPAGAPGELFIGGDGVTRGYLGRQELTEERFVVLPGGESEEGSGERFYASGDLARWIPSENDSPEESTAQLEFLGRADGQVKVRGFRVELGEVETVLRSHPAMEEAAVAAVDDGAASGARLVAYAVPASGESMPGADELRSYCQERLAPYMVPSAFIELKELPLSPTGKVDRRALVSQAGEQAGPSAEYVAPRTEKEQALAEIFAQVLKVEQVGVHDNFFELGGDSILSIQIASRARRSGLALTPKEVFEHPTVEALAAAAGEGTGGAEQGLVTGEAPLTPTQRGLLELDGEAWDEALAAVVEIAEHPDAEVLGRAVAAVMLHHDSLRSRFQREGKTWTQVLGDGEDTTALSVVDLAEVADDGLSAAVTQALEEARSELSAEAPLRWLLLDAGTERPARLAFVVHRSVADAATLALVLEDLQLAYGQLAQGLEADLPLKTVSFPAWSAALEAASSKAAGADDFEPDVQLPEGEGPGDGDGAGSGGTGWREDVLEAEETAALLEAVPPVYHTRTPEVMLTALALACRRSLGWAEVRAAVAVDGRGLLGEELDATRTAGALTLALPVDLELEDATDPGACLGQAKSALRDAEAAVATGAISGETPALSLAFTDQLAKAFPEGAALSPAAEGLEPRPLVGWERRAALEATLRGDRLHLLWRTTAEVAQETLDALATDFLDALRALIRHCESPEAGGFSAADFPLAQVEEEDLESAFAEFDFEDFDE